MLAALTRTLEERDPSTRGHSARLTALAEAIALRLGWDEDRLAGLRLGGALHDIGKLALDDTVLLKPGPLDDDELRLIRLHPTVGARIVARLPGACAALPYVLYHHERWDGGGYPSARTGGDIPIEARILAVADAFDAMTSARPYRRALSPEEALAEVERCAGTQFDPRSSAGSSPSWTRTAAPAARPWPPRELPRPRASSASAGSPRR